MNSHELQEATFEYISQTVKETPAVAEAAATFWAAYEEAFSALNKVGQSGLAGQLENAMHDHTQRLIRAAFLAGLTYDGKALLLTVE